MDKRFNFIKSVLTSLPLPADGKRAYFYDTKIRGLILDVTAKGAKTFYVYRKVNNKPTRIRLGTFPDLSIEQARNMADEINGAIALGENPQDMRRLAKEEMTLGDLFTEYMTRHAKTHKKSWKEDQNQYDRYLHSWQALKLSSISKAEIQSLHINIGKNNGHYAANRLLALLHGMFSRGKEWGMWIGENPAEGIKRFKEKSRERFLHSDELPKFFEALALETNELFKGYFLVSLLTGARKANVLDMRWGNVSLENRTWTIAETKNGTSQTIALTEQVIAVLQVLRAISGKEEFVFPSRGITGHLVEPKKAWKRLLERAGLSDLRIHDLRRTLGSWQAATGASMAIIGKSLNHKSVQSTAIYARLSLDPVRESLNLATEAMFQAGGVNGKKENQVVEKDFDGS